MIEVTWDQKGVKNWIEGLIINSFKGPQIQKNSQESLGVGWGGERIIQGLKRSLTLNSN